MSLPARILSRKEWREQQKSMVSNRTHFIIQPPPCRPGKLTPSITPVPQDTISVYTSLNPRLSKTRACFAKHLIYVAGRPVAPSTGQSSSPTQILAATSGTVIMVLGTGSTVQMALRGIVHRWPATCLSTAIVITGVRIESCEIQTYSAAFGLLR